MTRIVSAVGELIAKSGFFKVGVNAIARQAGVDKVLIYRYFGSLDGLYKAYSESSDFWPTIEELLGDEEQRSKHIAQGFEHALSVFFERYIHALRSRPLTIEVLAWETIERNPLTVALEEVREKFGLEAVSYLQALELPDADWLAITNMFTAAIHYLAIRARKIDRFTGMDITDDESWQRLASAIRLMVTNMGALK